MKRSTARIAVFLFAITPFLAMPEPSEAGFNAFCACCTLCVLSERSCPDSVTMVSGVREKSCDTKDTTCCSLCIGSSCSSNGAKCDISVQNMTKYALSGSLSAKGFSLGANWASETVTKSNCTTNPKPSNCQCVAAVGGLVYTVKTGTGVENCHFVSDCSYTGVLRELTGCYSNAKSCSC